MTGHLTPFIHQGTRKMPKNHHALDTGGAAAVKIEGNPCLERFQADLYGKSQLNQ